MNKNKGLRIMAGLAMARCIALILVTSPVTASPTANEYQQCHRAAAEYLQRCLDERPGYDNAQCWDRAKKLQAKCYADVRASHYPDPRRREAEEAARQEVESKRPR